VTDVEFADHDLSERVRERLKNVESALNEAVDSSEPFVAEAAAHLLNAGGKRFRPMLVLLAAEFGAADNPTIVDAAVVVELTHLATLYHDDVMDDAHVRRGALSANARWDNSVAILVGDWLFACASDRVADLGPEAVRLQARTFSRLVQGQIRETVGPGDRDPLDHYLSVVADKTGSLIATSAQFGAREAGADAAVEETLREFGEQIGVAFQLSDDILDVASEASGKTPGTDLREGVPTLPTLYALRSTDDASRRLRELLAEPISDDAELEEALSLLRAHPAMDQARDYVRNRADTARGLLDCLPDVPARAALIDLCTTLATRLT